MASEVTVETSEKDVEDKKNEEEDSPTLKNSTSNASTEGDSDPDLKALGEMKKKQYKKSLRLSSDDIVSKKCQI